MPTHEKHMKGMGTMPKKMPMMGEEMPMKAKEMPAKMPPTGMPMAGGKPAVNPALAKLPAQAKAYGVRKTVPPTKGGKK